MAKKTTKKTTKKTASKPKDDPQDQPPVKDETTKAEPKPKADPKPEPKPAAGGTRFRSRYAQYRCLGVQFDKFHAIVTDDKQAKEMMAMQAFGIEFWLDKNS